MSTTTTEYREATPAEVEAWLAGYTTFEAVETETGLVVRVDPLPALVAAVVREYAKCDDVLTFGLTDALDALADHAG